MKLSALTAGVLQRAITIYQNLAYGAAGKPRKSVEAADKSLEDLLAMFQKEQIEPIPGYPCVRYWLRLGNRNYPYMKLLLQEHLVVGEYYFAVDTHDQMDIRPDLPDFDAFMAVRRFNRELKRSIETGFATAGIDTASSLRRLVSERACGDLGPSRGTILIIDDEEDLAEAVALLLKARGFVTFKLFDPTRAVPAVTELLPDLVLLDYEMPEVDGLQVIAQLRADPATAAIPVLLASAGRVSMADIRKADGFLAKPFQEGLLYDMIDRLLQGRQVRP
ncbi:MAG: response regulator [Planctomycetes bacterium]|nr:response regulator [Planctomycetota bacterium]